MGIRNKTRRRTNQQRRETRNHIRAAKFAAQYPWSGASGRTKSPSPDLVDMMVRDAAHAGWEERDVASILAELADRDAGPAWCELVTARVAAALIGPLTAALRSGWEPRDISAVLRRKVGADASNLVAGLLPEALRCQRPDSVRAIRWDTQVTELAIDVRPLNTVSPTWDADIGSAVAALGFLTHLGALPELPWPTQGPGARRDLDPSLLDKVRALLAKAEATSFEAEGDAFLAKAQELMTRHNLDRALLHDAGQGGAADIEARRCWLDDPYLKQKGFLLAVVAGANKCRTVSLYEYGFVTLFGHPDDLCTTEMLFTALLVHATRQMTLPARARQTAARSARPTTRETPLGGGSASDPQAPEIWLPDGGKRDSSRPSYRRSFLLAYASRIGARLREATSAATDVAVESVGDALLPVLAERERAVDETLNKMFPNTIKAEFSITDRAGWAAGQAAADLADLSSRPTLTGATV
ncbi:MAG TPA: DUF2786 domain-containing protein [Acidimicrobiales bacterium]|nr:DUF2786 domain-containing protein [Acidimicrobiales bacterium]